MRLGYHQMLLIRTIYPGDVSCFSFVRGKVGGSSLLLPCMFFVHTTCVSIAHLKEGSLPDCLLFISADRGGGINYWPQDYQQMDIQTNTTSTLTLPLMLQR